MINSINCSRTRQSEAASAIAVEERRIAEAALADAAEERRRVEAALADAERRITEATHALLGMRQQ